MEKLGKVIRAGTEEYFFWAMEHGQCSFLISRYETFLQVTKLLWEAGESKLWTYMAKENTLSQVRWWKSVGRKRELCG